MGRSPCCSKIGLNRGAWNATEDQILIAYIKAHGEGSWTRLPKRAGLKRCGKSCRLRWMNYLKPDIKRGNISPEEEDLSIRLHKLLGNRWSLIAGRIPGRTDNEIKNYWNTTLSKRIEAAGSSAKPSSETRTAKNKSKRRKPSSAESKATLPVLVSSQSAIRTEAHRFTKSLVPNIVVSSQSAIRTEAHRFTKSLIPNIVIPPVQCGDNSATQTALNQIQEQLNQEMDCEADHRFQEAFFDQDMGLLKFSFSDYQLPADNQPPSNWTPTHDLLQDNNLIDFDDLAASFLDDQKEWIHNELK